jgi:chromosome segregation ATPase
LTPRALLKMKSLSLQLKEALEQNDVLTAQMQATTTDHTLATKQLTEMLAEVEAHKATVTNLQEQLQAATAKEQDLTQRLGVAQAEIESLKAAAQTVTQTASTEALRIVSEIGVPPVSADAAENPKAVSVDSLMEHYQELLKTDPRAAGTFYNEKLAPAIRKENK